MRAATQKAGQVELVTDPQRLGSLEDEWRALAVALGNPFVTPEWFRASLRAGVFDEPAVVVVRHDDGSLRGLLPLVRSGRRLAFAGADFADHLEPVAAPGDREAVARLASSALDLRSLGCTMLILDNVEGEPPWWSPVANDAPVPLAVRELKSAVLPYVGTKDLSWDDYLAGRSRNFRRDIRRKLDRLQRDHRVEFRRTQSAAELEADLAALYGLHDARWGGQSAAAGERLRSVVSEFAAAALERGWLRFWHLELDGAPAAGLLQWLVGPRLSSYYTGFDPALQREGAGLVLTAHTLRAAIEEGADEFNMLLGDEPWKRRFSTARREVVTVALVRRAHPARLLVSAEVGARRMMDSVPGDVRDRARRLGRPLFNRLPGTRG